MTYGRFMVSRKEVKAGDHDNDGYCKEQLQWIKNLWIKEVLHWGFLKAF